MSGRKRTIIMLVLICFLCSACSGRPWTKKEKVYAAILSGLAAVDAGQTNDAIHKSKDKCTYSSTSWDCEYSRYDRNPIVNGRSSDQVNFYFLSSVLTTLYAADYFEDYRNEILEGAVVLELGFVYGNYQIGLGVRY